MTMTLVFSTSSGQLTRVQVGPAEVLATFTAAYAATGWLGGLDGVRFMLSKCSRLIPSSSRPLEESFKGMIDQGLTLQNSQVHILTSAYGPLPCDIENAERLWRR
jgi:hypothetical protein